MSGEPTTPTVEVTTIPAIEGYCCAGCLDDNFIQDAIKNDLPHITLLLERIKPIEDEHGVVWAVLCDGSNEMRGNHLAVFHVVRVPEKEVIPAV